MADYSSSGSNHREEIRVSDGPHFGGPYPAANWTRPFAERTLGPRLHLAGPA